MFTLIREKFPSAWITHQCEVKTYTLKHNKMSQLHP